MSLKIVPTGRGRGVVNLISYKDSLLMLASWGVIVIALSEACVYAE